MSKRCGICGKIFGEEPRIPMDNGEEMCEECWMAFQSGSVSLENERDIDKEILDVIHNKEDYTFGKLEETSQWLKDNGYTEDATQIENYMQNFEKQYNDSYQSYANSKGNRGSKTTLWASYLKTLCYISLVSITVLGAIIGGAIFSITDNVAIGVLLGLVLGFVLGFNIVAVAMLFITMNENISTMTDNTAKMLDILNKDSN